MTKIPILSPKCSIFLLKTSFLAYKPIDRPFLPQNFENPQNCQILGFLWPFVRIFLWKKRQNWHFFLKNWPFFNFFTQIIEDKLYKPYIAWKIYLFSFNFLYLNEKIQKQELLGSKFFFLKKIAPQVSSQTHKCTKNDKICHFWWFSEK